jgi:hypothetical protein
MKHQEKMFRKRTAWTVIRDAYVSARTQRESTHAQAYADALEFVMRALKQRRLGARRHIPRKNGRVSCREC